MSVDTIIGICNQARKDFSIKPVRVLFRKLEWYQNYVKELQLINSERSTKRENAQRELRAIYNSHGWKPAMYYYKFRDKISPMEIISRTLVKTVYQLFFDQNKFKKNLTKAFYLLRQGCLRTIFPQDKIKQTPPFPESALAHKYCVGKGLEIGGCATNPFGLNTLNVDFTDSMDTVFKKEEIRLRGSLLICGRFGNV